jgi:PBSX family phage portal protein
MRSIFAEESDSEAITVGEELDSLIMKKFSLRERESEDAQAKIDTHTKSWKTQHCKWRNAEKKNKEKFNKKKAERIKEIQSELDVYKSMKDLLPEQKEVQVKLRAELDSVKKSYYNATDPPFPAADISIQTQADYLAQGEYIPKPYDVEALTELIEGSQRLKSSIIVYAGNSVGLGNFYRPTLGRNVADFTPEELEEYHRQGRELLKWYNTRAEKGKSFYQLANEVEYGKAGLGEGYFEVVDNRVGKIVKINVINATYMYEGKNRDRYIWVKNGKKKYFKRFEDKSARNSEDFSSGGPIGKRASRIVPFREYNLMSDVYGIPNWTGAIPQILGARYAAETNVHFFNNSASPRLIITVAGGAVDESTKASMKKFFQVKGKGRQNAHRTLLLCVSSKNQLSPNVKPPTINIEPLTVGTTDDGSFMKYQAACEETIREAFRISNTFYGTSGDSNRASAYTLRDQVVRTVFIPEGEKMANLCNDYFTPEWAEETGLLKVDEKGNEIEDNRLVELAFTELSTMSQKDESELAIQQLISGALSINDFRAEVLGLPKIPHWWAEMPKTLAVSALQLSEVSPSLVAAMLNDEALAAAIKQDVASDIASGEKDSSTGIEVEVLDNTTKSLLALRKSLQSALKDHHVSEPTLRMLDTYYDGLKDAIDTDDKLMDSLFSTKASE